MIDAFLDSLVWADLLLIVSTGLAFVAFQVKGRERILGLKITADSIFCLYMILVGAYTGAAGAAIAFLGGFIQVVTPAHMARQTKKLRLVLACILSIAAVTILGRTLTDSYPLVSVIVSRFGEVFQSTLIVRSVYLVAVMPWIIYNYDNGLYAAILVNILIAGSMIMGLWRNERRIPRDPVP